MGTQYLSRLSDAEIQIAQSDSHEEWGKGYTLDARIARLKHFMNDFPGSPVGYSGLKSDGTLVASLKRYHFLLQIAGSYYPTVGIGAVFTALDHRRQGYSTELLKAVLKEETENGTDCALLYSAIDPKLYAAVGFVPFRSEKWRGEIRPTAADGYAFVLSPENEWEQVRAYFEDLAAPESIFVRREKDSWKLLREVNRSEGDYWVEHRGERLGYVNFTANNGELFLQEYIFRREQGSRFWEGVAVLAAQKGCRLLSGWVTDFPYPTGASVEWRKHTAAMLNPLSNRIRTQTLPAKIQLTSLDYF